MTFDFNTNSITPATDSGGSGIPANMVTTDTEQTITGKKLFLNSFVSSDKTATTGNRVVITNSQIDLIPNSGNGSSINDTTLKLRGGIDNSGFSISTNIQSVILGQKATEMRIYASKLIHYDGADKVIGTIIDTGNFATVAPTKGLKYWTGTAEAYAGIASKNADTLYRTTDTNEVYPGDIKLGGNAGGN